MTRLGIVLTKYVQKATCLLTGRHGESGTSGSHSFLQVQQILAKALWKYLSQIVGTWLDLPDRMTSMLSRTTESEI